MLKAKSSIYRIEGMCKIVNKMTTLIILNLYGKACKYMYCNINYIKNLGLMYGKYKKFGEISNLWHFHWNATGLP